MSKIVLPIDTKSLYYNIKNDNLFGHTATVATPLKQGNTYNIDLGKILSIKNKQIDFDAKPDLIHELLKNSKSRNKITNVFVFDKISVNGIEILTDKQYCIFIKEEIDPTKAQFGRMKVHYPTSLKYTDVDFDINNKEIIRKVSEKLNNYAFIVQSFDYDTNTEVLNINALIVGEPEIPYSKVFINEKGVGDKFNKVFNEIAEDYDIEILSIRKRFGEEINVSNYFKFCKQMDLLAIECVKKELNKKKVTEIHYISERYPYALYDLRYYENNVSKYALVMWTTTNIKYFNLSIKKNIFCHDFSNYTDVFLVTDILNKKNIYKYSVSNMESLNKMINSIKLTDEGGL